MANSDNQLAVIRCIGSTWASSTWTSETKHFTSLNVAFYAAMIVVFLGLWLRSSMVVTEAPEAWPPAVDIVIPQASTVEMQQALCDARNHPHTEYPFWSSQMGFTKKQDFQTCGAQDGWLKSFANNLIGHDPRKVPWTRVCQDASGGGICLDDKDGVTSSGLGIGSFSPCFSLVRCLSNFRIHLRLPTRLLLCFWLQWAPAGNSDGWKYPGRQEARRE